MSGERLIIFDYDGTVGLTLSVFKESLRGLLERLGLAGVFGEDELEFMARRTPEIWLPMIISKLPPSRRPRPEIALEIYRDIYSKKHLKLIKAPPNIHGVLGEIRRKGYKLVLTTGRVLVSDFVPMELEHLKLNSLFDMVYIPNSPDKLKTFNDITRRFSVKEAVVVGDGVDDIEAGRSLSLKTIAVLYGFTSKEELLKHKLDMPSRRSMNC